LELLNLFIRRFLCFLKGHGKGSCRKLTEWELKNQKILECSYDEAERWSRYFLRQKQKWEGQNDNQN